ncbi:HTH domain protein (plasmid) [Haloferax gibbonsii]|uniref:HTH domain protein n=2 Tax=Haloferacaceae TaxID=1644056 RepID=A0A871BL45_HALGI|nr:HTH domain protein [Haloferax gibbonsii]
MLEYMPDNTSTHNDNGPEEFPTGDELPEESMTVDDLAPFSVDTDEFTDINELASAEWKESTTADERIRTVIKRTVDPKSANEIADTAVVSENKARDTLNRLVEEGIVRSHQTSSGKTYERDPDWYLLQQVHQLATSGDLVSQIQRIKQELANYQSQYETSSPEELLISDQELDEEELSDISHWRTAKREFNYLRAAYRLQQAKLEDPYSERGSFNRDSDQRVSP